MHHDHWSPSGGASTSRNRAVLCAGGLDSFVLGVSVARQAFEERQIRLRDFTDEGFLTVIPVNGDYYAVNQTHEYRGGAFDDAKWVP